MPKSNTLMNPRYDEIIILLIFLGSQDPKSNRGSLGSFGILILIMILWDLLGCLLIVGSGTVINSRYGEIVITAKLPVAKLKTSHHGAK